MRATRRRLSLVDIACSNGEGKAGGGDIGEEENEGAAAGGDNGTASSSGSFGSIDDAQMRHIDVDWQGIQGARPVQSVE